LDLALKESPEPIMARTGQPENVVRRRLDPEKDVFFTAEQAVNVGGGGFYETPPEAIALCGALKNDHAQSG
jgi:hypothetical protein